MPVRKEVLNFRLGHRQTEKSSILDHVSFYGGSQMLSVSCGAKALLGTEEGDQEP